MRKAHSKLKELLAKHSDKIMYFLIIIIIGMTVLPYQYESDNELDPNFYRNDEVYSGWYFFRDDVKVNLVGNSFIVESEAKETVTIYNKLPVITDNNNTILFRSSNQKVKVYVDETCIYSFGETMPIKFVNTPGNKWNQIMLDSSMSGSDIKIEITSNYESFSGHFSSIYLIPSVEVEDIIISKSIYRVFIALFLFLIGVAIILLSIINYEKGNFKSMNLSGQLFVVLSIWLFSESQAMGTIIKEPVSIYFIAMFSLLIAAVLFFKYLYESDEKNRKLIQNLINIHMVNLIVCFLIEIFTEKDIIEIIFFIVFVIISTITLYVIVAFRDLVKSDFDEELSIRFLPLIFIVIGGAIEGIKLGALSNTENVGLIFSISICLYVFFNINTLMQESYKTKKNSIKLQRELLENRRRLLLSQIKPHFLYNVLNSISALCKFDPLLADQAVIKFSQYLRSNMRSIDTDQNIEFLKEIEHVKNYVFLEQIRFSKLNVEYDLDFTDFEIPTLTLQPIIENAIKHGVSKKTDGGNVIISSELKDDIIIITIEDDGVGFDTNKKKKKDSHGLINITKRLNDMCNATVTTESQEGMGTKVTVRMPYIPKEKSDEDIIR